jgi:pimeloyl-ACP methyl ester carboxylesterase
VPLGGNEQAVIRRQERTMHLNEIAESLEPRDMTGSAEFQSLLQSATDLGIPHSPDVRYVSRQTVVGAHRFHFLEWGDPSAPAVLLLHGGNQTAHAWDLVSLHLSDRYHVYALDQRGHGDSEWVRDQDYGPHAMADDALGFIRQQGIEAPIIMGHSMGGGVTMTLAVREPRLPRALVFVDTGPTVDAANEGAQEIRNFIAANVEFDAIEDFVERVQAYDPFRPREHMERTARYNLFRRFDGKYVSKSDRVLHNVERPMPPDALQRPTLEAVSVISCPTLVIRGEFSRVLTRERAEAFARALPHGRWVEVARCGHNVQTQNTAGFLEAIRPFLEELR